MNLVSILQAGRRDFLEATSDIAVGVRPRNGWSVLECIEHVVTVEDRYLEWLSTAKEIEPFRDAEKELRLFAAARSRLTKVETPEPFRPSGRFAMIEDALAAFAALRDRGISLVRERGDGLYGMGVRHPRWGDLNGAECVQLMDAHARRHADQIREIVEEAE